MKYQKGFAPLIIILLIVVGIGVAGGGYVIYKNKQQQEKLVVTTSPKNSVTDTSLNTDVTISVPSHWKTYSDTEIGYSISYPPEGEFPFIVHDKYSLAHGISGYNISFVNKPITEAQTDVVFEPTLFITKYTKSEDFNKYREESFSECKINPGAVCSQTTVDGVEAQIVNTKSIPMGTPMQSVIFTKNNTIFQFSAKEKDKEVMEKMLASFKFIK